MLVCADRLLTLSLRYVSLQYGRVRGELDTLQQQVDKYHMDLKRNFKDINKRYTDQLIKVKVINSFRLHHAMWLEAASGVRHGKQ